jgi:hypothetical protein
MKKAPRTPPITPMINAPGKISLIYGTLVDSSEPNLRAVPDQLKVPSSPALRNVLRTASENVPIQHAKKTFQIISNFQNVLGFESS